MIFFWPFDCHDVKRFIAKIQKNTKENPLFPFIFAGKKPVSLNNGSKTDLVLSLGENFTFSRRKSYFLSNEIIFSSEGNGQNDSYVLISRIT